ncbi:MAG: ECF transporter S component, partial [Thermoplasmata archaeon]|nr:ECF transporter S component [Thermoplasmata archaeon]
TPFMMAGWGLIGYLAGLLYPKVKRKEAFLYIYSLFAGYLYGWITNISMLIFYPPTIASIIVVYSMSMWFDTLHSLGNLLFLHFFGGPVKALLEKKRKRMMVRIL